MTLSQREQKSAIEALIFASDEPLSIDDLFAILFSKDDFEKMRLQQDKSLDSIKSIDNKKFIEIIKYNFNYT